MGPTGHFIKFCSVDKHLRRQLITFQPYRAELKGNLLCLILPKGTFAVFLSGHRVHHRVQHLVHTGFNQVSQNDYYF